MRAVQLSNDHPALRRVCQDFARDHKLELPDGMKKDKGPERGKNRRKESNQAEKAQEERTGETLAQRGAAITEAWKQSDNGQAFVQALQDRGYNIARGDQKAYVVVDRWGEVHSLARQIDGAPAKDLKRRLSDYPLDRLPTVEAMQDLARRQREEQLQARAEWERDREEPEPEKPRAPTPMERQQGLIEKQKVRRGVVEDQRRQLVALHTTERDGLRDLQAAENTGISSDRIKRQPKGLAAFLTRITGIRMIAAHREMKEDRLRAGQHKEQAAALRRKHLREREEVNRRFRALDLVEKRELRSLQTAVNREQVRDITVTPVRRQKKLEVPAITPEQALFIEQFRDNARDITDPAPGAPRDKEKNKGKGKGKSGGAVARVFNFLADHLGRQDSGTAGGPKQKREARQKREKEPEKPAAPEFNKAARAEPEADPIAEIFNRNADLREYQAEKETGREADAHVPDHEQPQHEPEPEPQDPVTDIFNRNAAQRDAGKDPKGPDRGRDR
jgi:hypothetical protein